MIVTIVDVTHRPLWCLIVVIPDAAEHLFPSIDCYAYSIFYCVLELQYITLFPISHRHGFTMFIIMFVTVMLWYSCLDFCVLLCCPWRCSKYVPLICAYNLIIILLIYWYNLILNVSAKYTETTDTLNQPLTSSLSIYHCYWSTEINIILLHSVHPSKHSSI